MAVRKRFFINFLAKKIKQDLINKNTDLDFVETVSIGDITLMPSPEDLLHKDTAKNYLPAIFIKPNGVFNNSVNQNKSISTGNYVFTLRYAHYYDIENTATVMEEAYEGAELIAETLLEDHNLIGKTGTSYLEVFDKNNTLIGHILGTEVSSIEFDELESEVFKQLKLPIILIDIEYQVLFRSVYVKEG